MVEQTIECTREYVVTDVTFTRCDSCREHYAKAFDFVPVKKAHNFDNFVLCKKCVEKFHLKFNIDVKELVIAGSVASWKKEKEQM